MKILQLLGQVDHDYLAVQVHCKEKQLLDPCPWPMKVTRRSPPKQVSKSLLLSLFCHSIILLTNCSLLSPTSLFGWSPCFPPPKNALPNHVCILAICGPVLFLTSLSQKIPSCDVRLMSWYTYLPRSNKLLISIHLSTYLPSCLPTFGVQSYSVWSWVPWGHQEPCGEPTDNWIHAQGTSASPVPPVLSSHLWHQIYKKP